MDQNKFLEMSKDLQEAQTDDTPFMVADGPTELSIHGDPNKTQLKLGDYKVKFRYSREQWETLYGSFPQKQDGIDIINNHWVLVTIDYKNISITPRSDLKLLDSIFEIIPFFNKIKEDGSVEAMSTQELVHVYANHKTDVTAHMQNIVGTFLSIPENILQYMMPVSTMNCFHELITRHPEIFNQAELFFG